MSRSVSAVSMARSDYCRGPPRLPTPTASQVAIASGATHTVISPRWTSARSYADQFRTWYCVLYFGCTLDFMSRSCTCCRHDGQEVDRGSPRGAGSVHQRPTSRPTHHGSPDTGMNTPPVHPPDVTGQAYADRESSRDVLLRSDVSATGRYRPRPGNGRSPVRRAR